VGGSAAKFYAAVIEQDSNAGWRVSFNFGRIGSWRDWAHKVEVVGEPEARRVYSDVRLSSASTRARRDHFPYCQASRDPLRLAFGPFPRPASRWKRFLQAWWGSSA
jgi:hypothetical protein